ncbi:hypothetical protein OG698_09890 [Streptomyces sp. NBC_01003]|uniref:hypothetical protein n=1 Tax=Streptomyces sp. NBC_01003 TaxID=2903714 RepID=UPI00386D751B|nr:hypothetical protein OG698_09890 [Streptomyces sp. NBC_01003]
MAVKRTEYFNFDTGSARSGGTVRAETQVDTEDYYRRLDEARGSSLHTWGVCGGLEVSATPGQPAVTVQPGTALDSVGRTTILAADGFAVVDPGVDPEEVLNIPTVDVGADGLRLDTAGVAEGTHLLTLTWREVVGESRLLRLHAPWLRLLPGDSFEDVGRQVVLAEVSLAAGGAVTALRPGPRRAAGVSVERIRLSCARDASENGAPVGQGPAGELRARRGGGVDLTVSAPDGTEHTALSADGATGRVGIGMSSPSASLEIDTRGLAGHGLRITSPAAGSGIELENDDVGPAYGMFIGDDGAWRLANTTEDNDLLVVDSDGAVGVAGSVDVGNTLSTSTLSAASANITSLAIATDDGPNASLHVDGMGLHSGGGAGGYSFADRGLGDFVEQPTGGERWVWYAFDGAARLWSGEDRLSVGLGSGDALDVRGRMRVRERPGDSSSGIWFHQMLPDEDRAFVGMETDTSVGFWGNTGAQWGLVMDTDSGRVSCRNGLSVTGEAVFDRHFGRRDVPGVLHLFGSSIMDVGQGVLGIQSGGNVVAISGGHDSLGLGTITPQAKLDVNGDARVAGRVDKGGGGFRIDHPLDPGGQYLCHSFVESPDMANFYHGVVETDEAGEATVVLPDYFETLNRDFRYQLTPVGTMAQAAVTDEIKENRFTLRTDQPGVKVCWQVTGVRQDAWAQAHRIAVEEDKPPTDRGYYLHPAEHGRPETAGVVKHREGLHHDRSADE